MKRLAIYGPGLLGGSVALAARKHQAADRVALWARRSEAIAEIESSGLVDLVSNEHHEVLEDVDLVVLATPVGAISAILNAILPQLPKGAVITDLCSVKVPVAAIVAEALRSSGRDDLKFVGAHPMAGSDRTGFANASAGLFEGASCAIISDDPNADASAVALVRDFWAALGCHTIDLAATEHDRLVARISHLPHVAASALVRAGLSDRAGELVGTGFKDSTRVAEGAPEMWTEILTENASEVAGALEDYIAELSEVLANLRRLDNERVLGFLADARQRRQDLYHTVATEKGSDNQAS